MQIVAFFFLDVMEQQGISWMRDLAPPIPFQTRLLEKQEFPTVQTLISILTYVSSFTAPSEKVAENWQELCVTVKFATGFGGHMHTDESWDASFERMDKFWCLAEWPKIQ